MRTFPAMIRPSLKNKEIYERLELAMTYNKNGTCAKLVSGHYRTFAAMLLIAIPGCGESLEEMKARRDELRQQVTMLRLEVVSLETLTEPMPTNLPKETFDLYLQFRESGKGHFTEEELSQGYNKLLYDRKDRLAELEERLKEAEKQVDREIRR